MGLRMPEVRNGWLADPSRAAAEIRLDTPAWFAWLEAATTTRFAYGVEDHSRGYIAGWMTVRKERRQRGGMYWSVFRRQGERVRKIYLGRSMAVTQARLHAIAESFQAHGERR